MDPTCKHSRGLLVQSFCSIPFGAPRPSTIATDSSRRVPTTQPHMLIPRESSEEMFLETIQAKEHVFHNPFLRGQTRQPYSSSWGRDGLPPEAQCNKYRLYDCSSRFDSTFDRFETQPATNELIDVLTSYLDSHSHDCGRN